MLENLSVVRVSLAVGSAAAVIGGNLLSSLSWHHKDFFFKVPTTCFPGTPAWRDDSSISHDVCLLLWKAALWSPANSWKGHVVAQPKRRIQGVWCILPWCWVSVSTCFTARQGNNCVGYCSDGYCWIQAAPAFLWLSAVLCLLPGTAAAWLLHREQNSHLCDLQSSAVCLQYSFGSSWSLLLYLSGNLCLAGNLCSCRSANYFCFIWHFLEQLQRLYGNSPGLLSCMESPSSSALVLGGSRDTSFQAPGLCRCVWILPKGARLLPLRAWSGCHGLAEQDPSWSRDNQGGVRGPGYGAFPELLPASLWSGS